MTHDAASACSLVLQVALDDAPRGHNTPTPPEGAGTLYEGSMATQQSRRAGRASACEEWSSTQSSTTSSIHMEDTKANSPSVRPEVVSRPASMAVSKSFSYAQALKTSYPKVEGSGSMLGSPSITPSDSPCQSKMALRSETATPASSVAVPSPTPSVGSRKLVSPQGGRSQEVELAGGAGEEEEAGGKGSAEPPPGSRGGVASPQVPPPDLIQSEAVQEEPEKRKGGVVSPGGETTPTKADSLVQEELALQPSTAQLSPPNKDSRLSSPSPKDKVHGADSVTSEPRMMDMKVAPAPPVAPTGTHPSQGGVMKAPPGLSGHTPGGGMMTTSSPPLHIHNLTDHQKLLTQQRMIATGHRMYSLIHPPLQPRMAAGSGAALMPVPPAALLSSGLPLTAMPSQHHLLEQQQQQQQQGLLEHQTARQLQDMVYHHQQQQQPQPHTLSHHVATPLQTTPVSFSSSRPAGGVPSRALLGNQPASLSRQQLEAVIVNILLQDQQQKQQSFLLQQQQQHALQKQHNMMLQQQQALVSKAQMEKMQIPQHGAPQHGAPPPQHGAPQHGAPPPQQGAPQHSAPQQHGGMVEERKQQQQHVSSAQFYHHYQQASSGGGGAANKSEAPSAPYLLHNPHMAPPSLPMAGTAPPGLSMGLQPPPQHPATMFRLRGGSYLIPAPPPPQPQPPQLGLDPSPPLPHREPAAFPLAQPVPVKQPSLEVTSAPSTSSEAAVESGQTAAASSDSSDDQEQTESQKGSSLSITATPFVPMSVAASIPANPPTQPLPQLPNQPPTQHRSQHDLIRKEMTNQPTASGYDMPPPSSLLPQHIQTHTPPLLYPRAPMVPHTTAVSVMSQMVPGRPAYQVISPQAERPTTIHQQQQQQQQHRLVALQRQLSGGGVERRGQDTGQKEHLHYRLPVQQAGEQVGMVPAGMGNPLDVQGRQMLPQKGFPPYGVVGVAGGGVHGKAEQFAPVGRPMVTQQQQQQETVLKQAQALHTGSKRPLLPTPLTPHAHQTWPPTGGRPPVVPSHKLYPATVQRNVPFSARAGLLGGVNTYPRNPV